MCGRFRLPYDQRSLEKGRIVRSSTICETSQHYGHNFWDNNVHWKHLEVELQKLE